MSAYLDHMALRVRDLDWHIRFFQEVFDMAITMELKEAGQRKVWLAQCIQLNETPSFSEEEGRADHLGIACDDVAAVLEKAKAFDVRTLPQGDNWIQLPSGICIEVVKHKESL